MQNFTNKTENLINNVNPVFISKKLNFSFFLKNNAFLQSNSLVYKDLNNILKNKKITDFDKYFSLQFIEKQNISKILTVGKIPQN